MRGWKASTLAILTIAVSLSVWGTFLLLGRNLAGAMERWRGEARVIVYLEPGASEPLQRRLESWIGESEWVEEVRRVSETEARRRFEAAFPSLADLMRGWAESPLPTSLELVIRTGDGSAESFESWLAELAGRPGVDLVDDDRDWISQLERVAATGRTVGWVVGLVLLGAATFTIASVIRLAALMYQDEISIMRMVGATEFLIRGPFYCEGLLQGGIGALLAGGILYGGYLSLASRVAADGVLGELLLGRFLSPLQLAFLLGVGCAAGVFGAVISLKGEVLAVEE